MLLDLLVKVDELKLEVSGQTFANRGFPGTGRSDQKNVVDESGSEAVMRRQYRNFV